MIYVQIPVLAIGALIILCIGMICGIAVALLIENL